MTDGQGGTTFFSRPVPDTLRTPMSETDKRALRADARARRRLARAALGEAAGLRIAAHFLTALMPPAPLVVAGYWPTGDEVDSRPLLHALAQAGHVLALPVVVARGEALAFRRWLPETPLACGPYGIMAPDETAESVVPSLLLVPLLAFDARGHRLGHGGGYYDRTLAALAGAQAVGLAFAAQNVAALPVEGHDQPLGAVVTEEGVWRFDRL